MLSVFDWFAKRRGAGRGSNVGVEGGVEKEEEGVDGVGGMMKGKMDPSVLPGWMYARALALRLGEDAKGDVVRSFTF